MSNDSLYRSEFLRRSQNLKHIGTIYDGQHVQATNPLCGDKQDIDLEITDGKITDAMFKPDGCLVSKVSTDLLIDHITGKSFDEVSDITLEDIEKWLGTKLTPSRRKCAELGLKSVQNHLKSI